MTRLAPLKPEQLNESQTQVFNAIQEGPRGAMPLIGPFNAWVRSGDIGDAIQKLGASLRFDSILAEDVKELLICTVGHHYKAKFEFAFHEQLALKAGINESILNDLKADRVPVIDDQKLKLAYLVAEQLLDTHVIDNEYYAQGIEVFGERGMLELVSIIGYYCLVSLTLNAFTIPLDEGMSDPFPEKK